MVENLMIKQLSENGTQSKILRYLRQFPNSSRSSLVEYLSQPHAAISRSVARLLKSGCVLENEKSDTSGKRKRKGLIINPDVAFVLGVEYGPNKIESVLMDSSYEILSFYEEKVRLSNLSQKKKIEKTIKFISNRIEKYSKRVGRIAGIAMLDPGIVDSDKGMALGSSLFEHWHDVPIVSIVENEIGIPANVYSSNLSKVTAIDKLENLEDIDDFIYIEYGEGIACGVKSNGQFLKGHSSAFGEFGHVKINGKKDLCKCGGKGCLEVLSAIPHLEKQYREQTSRRTKKSILELTVFHDKIAMELVREAFSYLAQGIANLINVFNPRIVVFDHLLSLVDHDLQSYLINQVRKESLSQSLLNLEFRFSKKHLHLGAQGAAICTLNQIIN